MHASQMNSGVFLGYCNQTICPVWRRLGYNLIFLLVYSKGQLPEDYSKIIMKASSFLMHHSFNHKTHFVKITCVGLIIVVGMQSETLLINFSLLNDSYV